MAALQSQRSHSVFGKLERAQEAITSKRYVRSVK